ncbi:molybdenum cofactor guanylyltransferase MobA [Labrenzia aggregata]|uniref:Molybdenum cofactor guanylyltransferase n=2 Tax=Roseibium aggregatum TaxID=187304 RepID=A0A939J1F6_9HYPH|nr:molybdenum cofactor guanylyltransferase MobA [Roseibium aggregatum]
MAQDGNLTPKQVIGCVLAGGQSRRMGGGDKSLMDLGGKTMLEMVLERLGPQVPEIILNANGDPSRFAHTGLEVVADPVGDYAGPLAGVLAGLTFVRNQRPETTHVVSVAGDTPFFPGTLVEKFCSALPSIDPVIALATSADKLHPVFGLWPVALYEDLKAWLETGQSGKVLAFVDRHDSIEVSFEKDPATGMDPFFNANRPDDLVTVRKALGHPLT